jgi:pimeloyl-ACP methyl ester carboxylesterase
VKHLEFGGSGETLVFLHGGNVAGWMWGQQVPAFEDHRILVPDLPGFGASNDEAWPGMAGAADAVADLIGGTPAVIVGLSLGSSVAIELALRHPDAVSRLFLASPTVTPPGRLQLLGARAMMTQWTREGFWRTLARGYGLPAEAVEEFVMTGLGIRVETARAILDEVTRGVPVERLRQISAPTLAVAGGADSRSVRVDSLAALAEAGHTTAIAPGMHHQWNIENVELFNQSLRAWVERGEVALGLGARI